MSRIARRFADLKTAGRKGLIPYIAAGDPPGLTVPLMHALARAGADVIELGVPFSDPMADGPIIQRATERAIKNGVGLRQTIEFVSQFRQSDAVTPVVLMGYANPIERIGRREFAAAARAAGVDGVLVVDYPPEDAQNSPPKCGQPASTRFSCSRRHRPTGASRKSHVMLPDTSIT